MSRVRLTRVNIPKAIDNYRRREEEKKEAQLTWDEYISREIAQEFNGLAKGRSCGMNIINQQRREASC